MKSEEHIDANALSMSEKWTDLQFRVRQLALKCFLTIRSILKYGSRHRLTLLCYPERPRFYHMITMVAHYNGLRVINDPHAPHDLTLYFEDTTVRRKNEVIEGLVQKERVINAEARDISKTHVEEVFERIFGYSSHVDPRTYTGVCLAKSNSNALHDGYVVTCPTEPKPGRVYQRILNNREGDWVADIRVPIMDGTIPIIWKKYKHHTDPFNHMRRAYAHAPNELLSEAEIEKLLSFAKAFGLEYGEMDVIRDQVEDRLYIIDVNNTPATIYPVTHLPWKEYLRIVRELGSAFRKQFLPS